MLHVLPVRLKKTDLSNTNWSVTMRILKCIIYVWVTYLIKCDAFLCHVQCASTNCFAVELGVHTMCTYVDPEEKYSD